MATDNDIHAQAESFLNAMAPKPGPPPSRKKKEEQQDSSTTAPRPSKVVTQPSEGLSCDEIRFMQEYFSDTNGAFAYSSSKHVLIDSNIHAQLLKFVRATSKGKLMVLLNNILARFLSENKDMIQCIKSKLNNSNF